MNKIIFMTWKRNLPRFVFSRWTNLNPDYKIDFSLNKDVYDFIKKHYNNYILKKILKIRIKCFRIDLWRLCKLYLYGGVYADIDLIPHIDIDDIMKKENNTFYSCLAADCNSIFQAFMIVRKKKSPLILHFIISFLLNKPWLKNNGPTYDMYNCIKYNLNDIKIKSEEKYVINEVKIKVFIGKSLNNIKKVDLFYFPNDIKYTIRLKNNSDDIKFNFIIKNNILFITRIDSDNGWENEYYCDICIEANESIYLFQEILPGRSKWKAYVQYKNKKILDSRDKKYLEW